MASPRIGYPATPRTPPQERVLGVVLLCLFLALAVLLVGACTSQEATAAGAGGSHGSGGAGSIALASGGLTGAAGGTSGERPLGTLDGVCLPNDSGACVSTCSSKTPVRTPNTCVAGVPTCPDGYVLFSSCPEESCAQYRFCCDETTGGQGEPVCGTDGTLSCPDGSHLAEDDCIPPSLGVTSCDQLYFQPCSQRDQQCLSGGLYCSCYVQPPGTTGLFWGCWVPPP